jgi:predicted site-specific integrase-resolvase
MLAFALWVSHTINRSELCALIQTAPISHVGDPLGQWPASHQFKGKPMLAKSPKRAALYVRVSTDKQTIQNHIEALSAIAEGRGWTIIETYSDVGISGAKGRRDRPGLDRMLNDASRGKFDVIMAWAIDRVGRSLVDLLNTIQTLEACNVDIIFDQQNLDTTTPLGKCLFAIAGAFAEFKRSMFHPTSSCRSCPSAKGGQDPWQAGGLHRKRARCKTSQSQRSAQRWHGDCPGCKAGRARGWNRAQA